MTKDHTDTVLQGGGVCSHRHVYTLTPKYRPGFTMIEVVIMAGILVLIGSIVTVSFPTLSQRVSIQRSSRNLALSLREAQNMALAIREVDVPAGFPTPPGQVAPPAYGIYFNRVALPNSYLIFADLRGNSGFSDGRYNSADDVIVKTVRIHQVISIAELISDVGGANQQNDIANVIFTVPEARTEIRSDAGVLLGESLEIYITGPVQQFHREVFIRTTGQIELR